jgi:hypothetical protein
MQGEDTLTLTVENLPRHTFANLFMRLDANGPIGSPPPQPHLDLSVDGTVIQQINPYDPNPPFHQTSWYASDQPFEHTDNKLVIEIDVSNLPSDWYWHPALFYVSTYLPMVQITSEGFVSEDGIDEGKFVVTRDDAGYDIIRNRALTVNLEAPGGTASEKFDYSELPRQVTIDGGELFTDVEINPIDDEEIEDAQETIIEGIGTPPAEPALQYSFLSWLATAQLQLRTDDFEFVKTYVIFNSAGIDDDVLRDLNGDPQRISAIEWMDEDNDKKDDRERTTRYGANGDLGIPLVYRVSYPDDPRTVEASVRFIVRGSILGPLKLVGNGSGPGGGPSEKDANFTEPGPDELREITGLYQPGVALPATISNDTHTINLSVRKRNGAIKNYGQAKNHIYVTGADAGGNFETVIDVATRNAAGIRPPAPDEFEPSAWEANQQIIDAIWADFADPVPGVKNVKDEALAYWGAISGPPNMQPIHSVADLLKFKDGRCNAWCEFFVKTLGVHGIGARVSGVTIDAPVVGPRVGSPLPQGQVPQGTVNAEVWLEVKPLPAQNSAQPTTTTFPNHAVVKINDPKAVLAHTTVYDPSYGLRTSGVTMAEAEQAWQDEALVGFRWVYMNNLNHILLKGQITQHLVGEDEIVFH